MSRKGYKRKTEKQKYGVFAVFTIAPVLLSIISIVLFGICELKLLWLLAATSLSWLVLTGVLLYVFNKDKYIVFKEDVPLDEASVLYSFYVALSMALCVLFMIMFFKELNIV